MHILGINTGAVLVMKPSISLLISAYFPWGWSVSGQMVLPLLSWLLASMIEHSPVMTFAYDVTTFNHMLTWNGWQLLIKRPVGQPPSLTFVLSAVKSKPTLYMGDIGRPTIRIRSPYEVCWYSVLYVNMRVSLTGNNGRWTWHLHDLTTWYSATLRRTGNYVQRSVYRCSTVSGNPPPLPVRRGRSKWTA